MADKTKIEIEIDFGKSKSESAAVGAKIQAIGKDSKSAMDAVKKNAQTATADSTSRFKSFGEAVKTSFSSIGSKISGVFSGIKGKISGLMGEIKKGFGQGIGQYFGQGITGVVASVVTAPLTALLDRIDSLKAAREAMRDLEGQQQRLIDMDKKLGYTTAESVQQQMDLKIQMEQLGFANRNLTEEDKKRESAIQKVRDCYTSMKDTLADAMMSVVDVALPYLDSLTDTFEAYLPNAIGVFMGIIKNLPEIWNNGWDLMSIGVEKLKNILSYAFTDYIPKLFEWLVKKIQKAFKNAFSFSSIGWTILKEIGNLCKDMFMMFVRLGSGIAKMFGQIGSNIWKIIKGEKKLTWKDLVEGSGTEFMNAFDPDFDPWTGKKRPPQKAGKDDKIPTWERDKSQSELDAEAKMNGLFNKIGKDIDDSTKEAAANLAKNKAYRKEVTDGLNAPITNTEINRQNMQRQSATTSDAVGAYMKINSAVANRNPALLAADKQIKHDDKLASEQKSRDETTQKKLDSVEVAIRETAKDKSMAARGFAVVAIG